MIDEYGVIVDYGSTKKEIIEAIDTIGGWKGEIIKEYWNSMQINPEDQID